MGLEFNPVWADSMGAKSFCVEVETPDVKVVVDPGIAVMQPGFPASDEEKREWKARGRDAIRDACRDADVIVISHYHYDHFIPDDPGMYRGKLVLAKDPNRYINRSQRKRARDFLDRICRNYGGCGLDKLMCRGEGEKSRYPDPMEGLPLASSKDFGDYTDRREELLVKWRKRFDKMAGKWNTWAGIPELDFDDIEVRYPEGSKVSFGDTTLRFTRPMFHGIEFSTVGWVFATYVEYGGKKLIHSSDLVGPVIEDQAQWIIDQKPDILFLDGPMTYMFGYMLNRVNLDRAADNAARIVEEAGAELMVYDHHLLREPRYREHTAPVWETAKEGDTEVKTAAEYLGQRPKVLEAREG